jgi:hypothetical protein
MRPNGEEGASSGIRFGVSRFRCGPGQDENVPAAIRVASHADITGLLTEGDEVYGNPVAPGLIERGRRSARAIHDAPRGARRVGAAAST